MTFTVQGDPATAGSKKGFPVTRKDGTTGVAIVDASGKKGKNWRLAVQEAFKNNRDATGFGMLQGPVHLEVTCYFSRPKSHYGTGKNADRMKPSAPVYHTKKPDLTKLVRAIEDALTGLAWKDDSQVQTQATGKGYCSKHTPSHAVITVRDAHGFES
jgi:crossover junction endodeoxyribonuclease RusA